MHAAADERDQVWQWSARGLNGLLDLWQQWAGKYGPPQHGDAVQEVQRFLERAAELKAALYHPKKGK